MVRRRAKAAGIKAPIGCHTFRATGIAAYLENGGTLEHAQAMAAHESRYGFIRQTTPYSSSPDFLNRGRFQPGEWHTTFTILTTSANRLLQPIHAVHFSLRPLEVAFLVVPLMTNT
jgi:hypothetical protein